MSEKIEITYQEQTIRYNEWGEVWEWVEQDKTSDKLSKLKQSIDDWVKKQASFKRFPVIFRAYSHEPYQKGVATSLGSRRYGGDFFFITGEKKKRNSVSADSVWLDSPENMILFGQMQELATQIEELREKQEGIKRQLTTAKAYLDQISEKEEPKE